jgi:hypothetical protein
MAKSFSSLKTTIGLYDFLTFGKFKGCRVDSLIEEDYDYLQYLKHNKIVVFDLSVLEALEKKFSVDCIETFADDDDAPELLEDVPF